MNRLTKNQIKKLEKLRLEIVEQTNKNMQFEAVTLESKVIKFVESASEKIQLEAVKRTAMAIQFIKNPSEKIQLEAVRSIAEVIQFIKNPSKKVQLEAVRRNWEVIRYIEEPSEEIQSVVVNKNWRAIRFIKNLSEKLQLKVVKERELAIKYIENPTRKVQMEALRKLGNSNIEHIIQYINDPLEELQMEAVKKKGTNIKYIENPTRKVQMEALRKSGPLVLKYIKNPLEEVQMKAVILDGQAIRFIKNPSKKVREEAIAKSLRKSGHFQEQSEHDYFKTPQLINDKTNKIYDKTYENYNINEITDNIDTIKSKSNNENGELADIMEKSAKIIDDILINEYDNYNNFDDLSNNIGNGNPEKIERSVVVTKRNQTIVKNLKKIYKNKCQICNIRLEVGCNEYMSEVHHIQPLGEHDGPDISENMIVLCPNCHAMFDRGAITIDIDNNIVKHINPNNLLNNTKITIKHFMEKKYIDYHTDNIYTGKLVQRKDNKLNSKSNKNSTNGKNNKKKIVKVNNDSINVASYGSLVVLMDIQTKDNFEIKIEEYYNRQFMNNIQKNVLSKRLDEIFYFKGCSYKVIKIEN
ncbi:HNH endonuclease [Anaeromicrobium sediminis]|uniref:HNH nuclease domain-containing protein n=1 Tax=Anaeromicrobium sediminis TaxID=1478221 RepID=A0A267MQ26_9FIRM|nr:HNH endonuclease [Anaeromicrobium sediminis]PAB60998.1 hypothetical protein CCE28_00775 [Anaeromicrobium sediminis]